MFDMSRATTRKLPSIDLGPESFGQRLARLRKERGYTQVELAAKIGVSQAIITDYERDKLRMYVEMAARFARVLDVTTDELLGLEDSTPTKGTKLSLKIVRRLKKIELLPGAKQKTLLQTIDVFLQGAGVGA